MQPDVFLVCDQSKNTGRCIYGAPDMVIEVTSPSTRKRDFGKKLEKYVDAGVREYWIVDPPRRRTTIYRYEEDAAPMIVPFDQPLTVGIYSDLQITIAELLKNFE